MKCLAGLLRIFALLPMLVPVFAHGADSQTCADKTLATLQTSLQIGMDARILASACKLRPDDKSKMLVAIAYEPAVPEPGLEEMQFPFYVAMVNAETFQVVSRYKSTIGGDATTEIHEGSLWLDTARYFLNEKTRAFGLRVQSFRDRCTYEGGADNALTLFVVEGFEMRPVLQGLLMSQWRHHGFRCNGEEVGTTEASLSISVESTRSHGFADLLITARRSDNKRLDVKVRYDGRMYGLDPWFKAFNSWWQ